ncbi:MAG: hypothetical protein K9M13_01855, partial [Simkaniaceae bacterium]|nr:hypothetical protein [Simkaniaceae bacterium]
LIPPIQKRMQEMAPSQDVFDPQLANRYLTQALEELNLDKNHLPTIVLTHINSEIDRKIAQAVQEQIRSTLNIDVKLEELDFGYFLETTSKKKHQIALCYAIAQYNDPIDFLSRYTSKTHFKNYSNWSSQSFADLIEQSKSIYDFNERMKLYQQAEDIFMEDLPISPLYHFNVVFLINPQIKNFYISPIGSVHIDFIDFIPSPVL